MGFAEIDKKANGGGGNSAPVTLTKDQEDRLSRMLPKLRAKARQKMIEEAESKRAGSNRTAQSDAGSGTGQRSSSGSAPSAVPATAATAAVHTVTRAAAADAPDTGGGSQALARLGDSHVHFVVETSPTTISPPVIVSPRREPPEWWEVGDIVTRCLLFLVAGAAAWALFGKVIVASVGGM